MQVDNFYVKNFFTHLRALCTAAVHTKMSLLGGVNRFVEVGVISLGTTSQDGQQRQVKVRLRVNIILPSVILQEYLFCLHL